MAGETNITLNGNLTGEPDLRFTPSGAAVCSFTVAVQPRRFDKASNSWQDGEASFYRCTAWRQMAENIGESLTRGSRVVVYGTIAQRSFETREGEKRTTFEVQVDDIGASMKFATVQIRKAERQGQPAASPPQAQRPPEDPWATPPAQPQRPAQPQQGALDDPWTTPAQGGFANEPPY